MFAFPERGSLPNKFLRGTSMEKQFIFENQAFSLVLLIQIIILSLNKKRCVGLLNICDTNKKTFKFVTTIKIAISFFAC